MGEPPLRQRQVKLFVGNSSLKLVKGRYPSVVLFVRCVTSFFLVGPRTKARSRSRQADKRQRGEIGPYHGVFKSFF